MAVLIVGVAALLLIGAGALAVLRSVDLLVRRQMRRQVVIELRSGDTFRGLLVSVDARSVLLRDVEALVSEQGVSTPIDGELLIPRGDVKFLQRP